MSFYVQLLRQRVRQALTSLLERAQAARDLAHVLRELAGDMHVDVHLPVELRGEKAQEAIGHMRQRVRQALMSLLAVERTHFAHELAVILRELADELDPPKKREDGDEGSQ